MATVNVWALLTHRHNLIAPMSWEFELARLADVSVDLLRFALAFWLHIVAGFGLRFMRHPSARNVYSLITGLLLVYYPFGSGVLHVLPPAGLTYLAMWLVPRKCGTLAWAICFPYLIAMHVANASGLSWSEGNLDFTGGEMVLTLKLIAIAVSYQDSFSDTKQRVNPFEFSGLPGIAEYWGFIFCFGNLLAGPSLEFKDYRNFINGTGDWASPAGKQGVLRPSASSAAVAATAVGVVSLALHLLLLPTFNVALVTSEWYNSASVPLRFGAFMGIGFTVRVKYYYAWKLSEAALVLAGLSYNGVGPDGHAKWDRYRNVYVLNVELQEHPRKYAADWNTGTGTWLRRYVYERLTPPGRKPSSMTLALTMTTSAVWHGLYPGYLFFFLSLSWCFEFCTVLFKLEQRHLPATVRESLAFRGVKVLMSSLLLNYLVMPFVVLQLRPSVAVWRSVYFAWHVVTFVGLAVNSLVGGRRQRVTKPVAAAVPPKED